MSLDKFADWPYPDDPTLPDGATLAPADDGGNACELADINSDGSLCPVIKWCCNANGVGEEEPAISVLIEGQQIQLTGFTDDNKLDSDCEFQCGLVGEDWDDEDIPPKLGKNGWIRECLLDCNGDAIVPDPLVEDDGCVDWCHGFDRDLVGGGKPIYVDVPVCGDENETKRIRIHQFGIRIRCQCCDPDDEAV